MTKALAGIGWIQVAAFVAACGSTATLEVKTPDPEPPPTPPAPAAPEEAAATTANVTVDEKIAEACDLPTPRFGFDSSNVDSQAASTLDAVAKCFVTGPLKGKGMKLVGHADPRGETQYNFALGHRRAGTVAQFLIQKGVPPGRVATSSRGELDATGSDEDSWARDRRVDILLAE